MHKQAGSATLYTLDMICMGLAITLIGLSLYLLPYLLGFQNYDVPEFIVTIAHWVETHSTLNTVLVAAIVLTPFVLAGIAFVLVSRLITFYLETHDIEPGVPHVDAEDYQEHLQKREHAKRHISRATILVVSLMVLILVVLFLLEYYVVIQIFA